MKIFLLPIVIIVVAVHLIFFMLIATTNTNPDEELFHGTEKIENKNTKNIDSPHVPAPEITTTQINTKTENKQTISNNTAPRDNENKQTVNNNSVPKNSNNDKPKNPSVAERKEYHDYVIKKGDNLTVISKKYKIDINTIMKENNMKNSIVWIGRKLKIPKTPENSNIN